MAKIAIKEVLSILLNILLGFVIPWIIALIVFKDKNFVLWIALFSAITSFIPNELGFHSKMWNLYPWDLESIPFNIGLFAVAPVYYIYIIDNYGTNPVAATVVFSTIMTLCEYIGVLVGRVVYLNGWNIIYK